MEKPHWTVDPVEPEYYAAKSAGNYKILAALLAFVALTVVVMIYGFDTQFFRDKTAEREARQEQLKAQAELRRSRAIVEGEALRREAEEQASQ